MADYCDELDFEFDKFMDDIQIRETAAKKALERAEKEDQDNLPKRQMNRRFRDLPKNKIVFRK